MRTYTAVALLVALVVTCPTFGAPMSMFHSMPKGGASEAMPPEVNLAPSSQGNTSRISKWLWGDQPAQKQTVPPPSMRASVQPVVPVQAFVPNANGATLSDYAASVQEQRLAQNAGVPTRSLATGNMRTLREQGHAADRAGNLAEAERLYRLAITANPANAAVVNDLALCLARQGKLDSSLATFAQAIHLRPEKPLYRNNIATVLVELGRVDEAGSHLASVYPPAITSYNLGHLLQGRGRTAEAVASFRAALSQDPTLSAAQEALVRLDLAEVAPVAAVPQPVPTVAPTPTAAPSIATVPSFPRLLPPVIDR